MPLSKAVPGGGLSEETTCILPLRAHPEQHPHRADVTARPTDGKPRPKPPQISQTHRRSRGSQHAAYISLHRVAGRPEPRTCCHDDVPMFLHRHPAHGSGAQPALPAHIPGHRNAGVLQPEPLTLQGQSLAFSSSNLSL